MTIKRTGRQWLAAALAASAVLTAGCARTVDTDDLPGAYRNEKSGGQIRLARDGAFTATHVSISSGSDPADFHGRWEFVDSSTASDFIYLTIEDNGLGKLAGVQLYTSGDGTLEFSTPDNPWSLKLTKVPVSKKLHSARP
ncbi:hypothetical protein ACFVT5_13710 [Streptomyces sp. NPDC058001]|uniref:hypothetical protein n=1 Tax=Streptomyces sp. NPDC058001 TaxID=3346300 RepID=UPI0036EB3F03